MGEPAENLYVPEPGKVAIKDLDGSVSLVKQGDLSSAQNEGARPATEAEYFGARHGTAGQVASGVVGAARGATFGAFDPAFIGATRALAGDQQAEDYRNTLRLLKEANPNATLGGEVAGALVPSLVGGGAAGAASLGEGAVARFGARALQAAPRALAEGVGIGVGQQFSEDTIYNRKLAGEAYVTAGLKGGTIGLLLGAGGAGALGLAGDKLGGLLGRGASHEAEGAGVRLAEEGGPYRAGIAHEAEAAGETGGRKSLIQRAEDLGNEQAYKATGANPTNWKQLGGDAATREETAQRIGKMLQSETLDGRPLVEATASQEQIAQRISAKQKEIAKTFAPMYREADQAAARPSVSALREGMDELRAKHASTMFGESEMRGAEDTFTRLEKSLGESPTNTKLWEARKEIDNRLQKFYARDKTTGVIPEGEGAMRDLRAIVNNELAASVDRAGAELGGTLGDRLRMANQLYGDLSTAKSAASRASARMAGHQQISITDVIAGATGGLGGLVASGLNMVRRKYGNQIAAHVLGKATQMQGVQRAASRLDEILDQGAKAFVTGGKGVARPARVVSSDEIRAIREATRSPETVNSRVAAALGDLPAHDPETAQAAALTATRAAAWAQYALPKQAPPIGPMFTQPKQAQYSDGDRIKATATIEGMEGGEVIVDRLRQGQLTDEHVAALRYVHPETYAALQKYLGDHATQLQATMTQQQLTRLGILFGEPLTEQDLPENRRAFQASFTQGNQAPGTGGSGGNTGPAKPVQGGGNGATAYDRLEAGK